jgi:hypothetical protein
MILLKSALDHAFFIEIQVILFAIIFLLVSRKEENILKIKYGTILKKISLFLFISILFVPFYIDLTLGITLLAINTCFACIIVFYPKQTILITLCTLITISLLLF